MSSYVENWFDSEIGGKDQFRLVVESLKHEYNEFNRMLETIEYCNESSAITVSINENKFTEVIHGLWEKFKNFVEGIWKRIKDFFAKFIKKSQEVNDKVDNTVDKGEEEEEEVDLSSVKITVPVLTIHYPVASNDTYRIGEDYISLVNEIIDDIREPFKLIKENFTNSMKLKDLEIKVPENLREDSFEYVEEEMSVADAQDLLESVKKESSTVTKGLKSSLEDLKMQSEIIVLTLKNTPTKIQSFGADKLDPEYFAEVQKACSFCVDKTIHLLGAMYNILEMSLDKYTVGESKIRAVVDKGLSEAVSKKKTGERNEDTNS